MASRHETKRRANRSSMNYHSTPRNIKSFEPDTFRPKNTPKPENKVTTSQLKSALAGIWSYIGQSEGFKSNETLNDKIFQNPKSAFEDLKEMKKQLLFSHHKMVPFPIVKHSGEDIEAWYRRDIYKPNFIIETVSKSNIVEENIKEEETLVLENQTSDNESEFKIGFSNSNDITNSITSKDISNNSSCSNKSPSPEPTQKDCCSTSENSEDKFKDQNIISIKHRVQNAIYINTSKDLSNSPSCSNNNSFSPEPMKKVCCDTSENTEGKFEDQNVISIKDRVQNAICINSHALAGALAGTMVSICLHPIDTIKTIIQSRGSGTNSFYSVLKCTLTERGLLGLYRGIASNIASSAPISAIYTFTYESIKGTLLPIFPKEYQSLTHCISGGCSSIATSFVYTPSERIKQQMQVGTQNQNCWSALIGCLERGGVASLYAGWGAVLCRNIPHSIIKFYTYERLKQFIVAPDCTPSSLQTLACGGLAGSTAALFTTPFDVVKTRIQTQSPASVTKYNGVFHALKEITNKEGLQGLYRGLTPRLGMYVSQGAIFFASYEFLKSLFALQIKSSPSREFHNEDKVDEILMK